jgi:GT2 family glycosyltransferase
MILGVYGVAAHAHQFMHHKQPGYCGRLQCLQEYSSLTGALMLVRCSAFNQVGGFDIKQYPTVCNDVDLCLRFKEIGFRCIYNPMVKATHLESKTRGISSDELFYKQKFQSQYSNILKRDCFYNPNFALDSAPFRCYRCFPISEQVTELSKFFEMK